MKHWLKNIASWQIGKTLYLSVVFSWDVARAAKMAREHKGTVIVGGPAAMLNREAFDGVAAVRDTCQEAEPILFHNPLASYSSRGCPNKCPFCAVPKIEGELRETPSFRPAPLMCDNNFLATSRGHQIRVVDRLTQFAAVDFNQGLDARLFTPEAADNLGRLKLHARFAFDHPSQETAVADAIELCRERTSKHISVYVLFGYKDTPTEAVERMEWVRARDAMPVAMRYQPLDATERNAFYPEQHAHGWTQHDLKRVHRYYSRLNWLGHIPFADYNVAHEELFT